MVRQTSWLYTNGNDELVQLVFTIKSLIIPLAWRLSNNSPAE